MISEENLPTLPTAEEVYDFDTFGLHELQDFIKINLSKQTSEKWLKRARKILSLVEVEIQERQGIENFGQDCVTGRVNDKIKVNYAGMNLEDFASCNRALEKILIEVRNRPANYLDNDNELAFGIQEEEEFDDSVAELKHSKLNSQIVDLSQHTGDLGQSIVSDGSQMSKYNRLKNNSKKQQMHDFMKNLLQKTKVNEQQQVVGAAAGGKYIPPTPQPQLTPLEKSKLARMQKQEAMKPHVPVVSLNTQLGEKTNSLTLGKPVFSNRDFQKKLAKQQKEKEREREREKEKEKVRRQSSSRQSTSTNKSINKINKNNKMISSSTQNQAHQREQEESPLRNLRQNFDSKNQQIEQAIININQQNTQLNNEEDSTSIVSQQSNNTQQFINNNVSTKFKYSQSQSNIYDNGQDLNNQNINTSQTERPSTSNQNQQNKQSSIQQIERNIQNTNQNQQNSQSQIQEIEIIQQSSDQIHQNTQSSLQQIERPQQSSKQIQQNNQSSTYKTQQPEDQYQQNSTTTYQNDNNSQNSHPHTTFQNNEQTSLQKDYKQFDNHEGIISNQRPIEQSKDRLESDYEKLKSSSVSYNRYEQTHISDNANTVGETQTRKLSDQNKDSQIVHNKQFIKDIDDTTQQMNPKRNQESQQDSPNNSIQEEFEDVDQDPQSEEVVKQAKELKKTVRTVSSVNRSNVNSQVNLAYGSPIEIKTRDVVQEAKQLIADMKLEDQYLSNYQEGGDVEQFRNTEQFQISKTISFNLQKESQPLSRTQEIGQITGNQQKLPQTHSNIKQKENEKSNDRHKTENENNKITKVQNMNINDKNINDKNINDKNINDKHINDKTSKLNEARVSKEIEEKVKKPRVPIAPRPKQNIQNPVQSKYIMKMLQFIDDSTLIDYSPQIPSFQHLFSAFYNNSANYSQLDAMKEILGVFQQHVERVDRVDQIIRIRSSGIVHINPNEMIYINDPRKIVAYATKTGIDIQQYIQRQMVFNERLSGDEAMGDTLYFRVVKSKEEVYDIITRSFMRKKMWTELPHGMGLKTSWNILWTWSKPQIDMNKLLWFQRVNHFPFNKNISRKDLLKKNIERCQRLGVKAAACFDIIPWYINQCYKFKEYVQFMERFYQDTEKEGDYNLWIMKPTSKSRGRGIQVVNDISQVMYAEPVVLQKYLKEPMLLKGYKFDMRIYVVVTSFNPLEAFLYQEGFARLTTQLFNLNLNEIKNQMVHLTNFAIQKNSQDFSSGSSQNSFGGSKISLRQLKEQLYDKGVEWKHIWTQVQEIIVKSLVAVQTDIPTNPNCFELFGYDIIIDTSKRCWLLEVNSSPSLAREYILDELVKQQLVDDIFDLIDTPYFDRSRLCEVLERRILEEQGLKSQINTLNNSKLQLNRDLNYVLMGKQCRKYGEMPAKMGGFQRIAPSEMHEKIQRLVQSYKSTTGPARATID